jgi:hypothetical protein
MMDKRFMPVLPANEIEEIAKASFHFLFIISISLVFILFSLIDALFPGLYYGYLLLIRDIKAWEVELITLLAALSFKSSLILEITMTLGEDIRVLFSRR